jgi:hypothetical protein
MIGHGTVEHRAALTLSRSLALNTQKEVGRKMDDQVVGLAFTKRYEHIEAAVNKRAQYRRFRRIALGRSPHDINLDLTADRTYVRSLPLP